MAEEAIFDVVDGAAVAERPDSLQGMKTLGEALERAGFFGVEIDGEEWSCRPWGVSPFWVLDHPFIDEVDSAWSGGGGTPLDRLHAIHRIGDFWFEFIEPDITELGQHPDLASAVAASESLEISPSGGVRISRPGDELSEVLDELGVEVDDPDEYQWFADIGTDVLGAVAESEVLLDWGDVFAVLEFVREVDLGADEIRAIAALGDRLPIGDESLRDSTRWAKLDAERRKIDFGRALGARAAASERWAEWEHVYGETVVEVRRSGRWEPAVREAARRNIALAVVTAWNPMSEQLSDDENRERNLVLKRELGRPKTARGRSPDGEWEEESFLVPYDERVVELAHQWGQAAIFRVTSEAVEVVRLVG